MSEANRTRKWREKRRAEGKKSYTVLLSEEAQQIIKCEKEKSGENYSDIIERALKSLKKPAYHRGLKFRPVPPSRSATAFENVTSDNIDAKNIPILIDDLENYELNDPGNDPRKAISGLGLSKKENMFSRLVKAKFPGKKGWFK